MPTPATFPESAKAPSYPRLRNFAKRALRTLLLVYLMAMLGMYFFQTYLIFPGTFRQGTEETRITALDGETLVQLETPDHTPLAGLFGLADLRHSPELQNTPRPTVLFFYGNGDAMSGARSIAELFRAMGYHCMIVDYPGFGMSGGKPSEQGCYAAAEAAYQYVLSRPDVDRTHLVAAGWSLGGGVAIDLIHKHRNDGTFCALMTFSAFTSVVDVGKATYPFLPVDLLVKHRFMSAEKIRDLQVPYFNGHGTLDNAIPFAQSAGLIQAYGGKPENVTRFVSPNARHSDFFDVDNGTLYEAMQTFLSKATR